MPDRPAIPAAIQRQILIESGHRCAVCGAECPLERAHIIPWTKSEDHAAENLICLCASCHERADNEGWGEVVLREYKRLPWVHRHRKYMAAAPEPTARVQVTVDMDIASFDEKKEGWIKYGVAGFLGIEPSKVCVRAVEPGSVKLTLELPRTDADFLINAYRRRDYGLMAVFEDLRVVAVTPVASVGSEIRQEGVSADGDEVREIVDSVDENGGPVTPFETETASLRGGARWRREVPQSRSIDRAKITEVDANCRDRLEVELSSLRGRFRDLKRQSAMREAELRRYRGAYESHLRAYRLLKANVDLLEAEVAYLRYGEDGVPETPAREDDELAELTAPTGVSVETLDEDSNASWVPTIPTVREEAATERIPGSAIGASPRSEQSE